jgi:hypothetical protein
MVCYAVAPCNPFAAARQHTHRLLQNYQRHNLHGSIRSATVFARRQQVFLLSCRQCSVCSLTFAMRRMQLCGVSPKSSRMAEGTSTSCSWRPGGNVCSLQDYVPWIHEDSLQLLVTTCEKCSAMNGFQGVLPA